jgi:hypothetical protein
MSEENPRAAIGLTAAHEGDPRGLRRFLDFVHRELWSLSLNVTNGIANPLAARLRELSRDADRATQFVDGYIAALDQKKKQT